MGHPLKRKEDRRLLTGLGKFVDDIKLPGMAYAAILRSPYAHARILGIDMSKAERLEGVICSLVGEEVEKITDPLLQLFYHHDTMLSVYYLTVESVILTI